jgi:HTH-type transcriptional regulator/antitoxin HigA
MEWDMPQAFADNLVTLIQNGAPHLIHDEKTLAGYTEALFSLTGKESPNRNEQEVIDLLTLLISDYESRYRIPQAEPIEVLRYLMDQGNLRQQDLKAELGSLSNVSMVLSGQRRLTLDNASALANRFHLDIRAFLPVPSSNKAPQSQKRREIAPRVNKSVAQKAPLKRSRKLQPA